jgi:hypothetical protein
MPNIACLRYNNGCQFRGIDLLTPEVQIYCKSKHRKFTFTKVLATVPTATFSFIFVSLFGNCLSVPHAHRRLSGVAGTKQERNAVSTQGLLITKANR